MGFNYLGLIIVIVLIIPNIIVAKLNPNIFENEFKNKFLLSMEQIGRYGCMALMVLHFPYVCFGFFFDNSIIIYGLINSLLLITYCIGWIICLKKHEKLRACLLSIIPTCIFFISGIIVLNFPLIICSIVFGISHITISIKNYQINRLKWWNQKHEIEIIRDVVKENDQD